MNVQQIEDASWNYTEQGNGQALLLIHAFPMDSRMWAPVAGRLSGYRIVCVDVPGFGKSTVNKPFTMESLADDLARFAAKLELAKFVLGGLSMGGYLSFAYASKYADTLAGLCLCDTKAAADTPPQKQNRNRLIGLARTGGAKAVADEMLGKLLSEQTIRQSPQTVRSVRGIMESVPAKTMEIALAAMRDRADYTSLLPKLSLPVQIIVGQEDEATSPAIAESMRQAIPGAALAIIPAAGHLSAFEQPDAVANVLRDFLRVCFPQT